MEATNSNGDPYRMISDGNTSISDSGYDKIIKDVKCENNRSKYSLIFQLDRSASMSYDIEGDYPGESGKRRWDAVIKTIKKFITKIDLDYYKIAFMKFNSVSELVQPFSSDITQLNSTLDDLLSENPIMVTDFNAALIGIDFRYIPKGIGALQYARESKWKPIVILITDGKHNREEDSDVQIDGIMDSLSSMAKPALIYGLNCSNDPSQSLQQLSIMSGGDFKTGAIGEDNIEFALSEIIMDLNENPNYLAPCEITFEADQYGGEIIISTNINGSEVTDTAIYENPIMSINEKMKEIINVRQREDHLVFRFENGLNTDLEFRIVDLNGNLLLKEKFKSMANSTNKTIDLSQFNSGLYVCSFSTNGQFIKTHSFIITR